MLSTVSGSHYYIHRLFEMCDEHLTRHVGFSRRIVRLQDGKLGVLGVLGRGGCISFHLRWGGLRLHVSLIVAVGRELGSISSYQDASIDSEFLCILRCEEESISDAWY